MYLLANMALKFGAKACLSLTLLTQAHRCWMDDVAFATSIAWVIKVQWKHRLH